jgi:hypothetical protein
MGKWFKTKERIVRIQDIWRDRIGKIFGLTKAEYMVAFYGDACKNWNEQKYKEKWIELRQATRWVSKVEQTRNVICLRVSKIDLDDTSLNSITKFGKRIFTGHLYFQPDNERDVNDYKDKMDKFAAGMEESGKIALENFLLNKLQGRIQV